MEHQNTTQVQVQPADKAKIWGIWKVMLFLLAVTAVEFIVALAIPLSFLSHPVKVFIYIALTIVKAWAIVGEFMHLSHERKSLIWSILLPTMFIVFLLFILIVQGNAIFDALY
ncbi:MAG: cytochrome C oxidase subunit IV family protein [Cyclobacteriaceae bacterium]